MTAGGSRVPLLHHRLADFIAAYPVGIEDANVSRFGADTHSLALAREAARALSTTFDASSIAVAAQAAAGFSQLQFANSPALHEAARAFASVRPLVAPELAESLRAMTAGRAAAALAEDFGRFHPSPLLRGIDTSALLGIDQSVLSSLISPSISESLKALMAPSRLSEEVAAVLRTSTLPSTALGTLAAEALRNAITVAESAPAEDAATEALAELDLEELPVPDRAGLRRDLTDAIAALGTVVALLVHNQRLELASAVLALLAILLSIYSRLEGE